MIGLTAGVLVLAAAAVMAGLGIVYPTSGPTNLLAASLYGAIGLQLVIDARYPAEDPPTRSTTAIRKWSIALGCALLLYLAHAAFSRSPLWLALAIGAIPTLAVVRVTAQWWPRVLARAEPDGIRPGYIIGGLGWGLLTALGALCYPVVLMSGINTVRSLLTDPNITTHFRLLFLPLLLVVPMRVLYAGLPRRRGDRETYEWRRKVLVAAGILSVCGLGLALVSQAMQTAPLLGSKAATMMVSVGVWAAAVRWVTGLWESAQRDWAAT